MLLQGNKKQVIPKLINIFFICHKHEIWFIRKNVHLFTFTQHTLYTVS